MGDSVRQLNLRVPETIVQGLDEIASKEQIDRTALARKMLSEAIQQWKVEDAIAACRRGEITKARAPLNWPVCRFTTSWMRCVGEVPRQVTLLTNCAKTLNHCSYLNARWPISLVGQKNRFFILGKCSLEDAKSFFASFSFYEKSSCMSRSMNWMLIFSAPSSVLE